MEATPKSQAHWGILISIALAIGLGALMQILKWEDSNISWLLEGCGVIGTLFMQALRMIIVPLIASSIISSVAGLHGMEGFARMGAKTIGLFALTTALAAVVGITMFNLVQPGLLDGVPHPAIQKALGSEKPEEVLKKVEGIATVSSDSNSMIQNLVLSLIPSNVIQSATNNSDMLGLIVFSILFGFAMTRLPRENMTALRDTVQGINETMILLTGMIMKTAPIGIFALLLPMVFKTGPELILTMAKFMGTVAGGLAIHLFVTLPLLMLLIGRINPIKHFKAMFDALLTAFSTASSSATVPVTMRCLKENAKVSRRVRSFVIPLGATVNMDGTALFECVAVLFICQVLGVEMGLAAQFFLVVLACLTSIGVAGVPSASMVAIALILNNTLDPKLLADTGPAIALLLMIDRPLDMLRTATNVFGDSAVASIVARSEGEKTAVALGGTGELDAETADTETP